MTNPGVRVALSEVPLDVAAVIGEAGGLQTGAIGVFVGTVRSSPSAAGSPSKTVTRLDYEAHPELAEPALRELAIEAAGKWELDRVVAVHRIGACELGEPTVVIACSAAHRGAALDACRWLIDAIKTNVPIWKKEIYTDGSAWVGTEGDG